MFGEIYNFLRRRWWGIPILLLSGLVGVLFTVWSSLPDSKKEAILNLSGWPGEKSRDEFPPLQATFEVSPQTAKVGEIVTWTCMGQGGNGFYSYEWTGTDGLKSNYPSIDFRYEKPGIKRTRVEILSNHEAIFREGIVTVER